MPRHGVMMTSGIVNLALLGLVGWQSAGDAIENEEKISNDNFAPGEETWELIHKLAEAYPSTSFPLGIKTIPRLAAIQFLEKVKDLPGSPFIEKTKLHLEKILKADRREGRLAYQHLSSPNRGVATVTGEVNPLASLDEGRFSETGNHAIVGGRFAAAVFPWLTADLAPYALFSSHAERREKYADLYLHRGYVKANANGFEIEVGQDTVQWGFGRQGSMAFSGEARPFPLLRLANSRPVFLPGFLEVLGPTRVDFFVTALDGDRTLPHSILHGMKTTFQPHPRFEFGLGQSIEFGGKGSGSWNPLNYFTEKLTDDSTNRNFMLDMRWRIPGVEVEPYAELFWEDCCDAVVLNPRDTLNLFGLAIPNLGSESQADLAFEWVRTNGITYRHSTYSSGFYYKHDAIGHPIGPDGMGFYGIFRYFHTPRTWWKIIGAVERYGRQEPLNSEDRGRMTIDFHQGLSNRHLELRWQAGYERVMNFEFQAGNHRNNFLLGLMLEIS
ncbi:MAG: hypothetical protein HY540_05700 [Deltaproteobacteria bacterium]|nr:hypothetical protein [Deltaproteobacteria bacterium]